MITRNSRRSGVLALILALGCLHGAKAAVTSNAMTEVILTQATIEYQSKNYAKCQSILREVLKSDPKNIGALEMLALTYRQTKDDNSAVKTYETLYSIADKTKAPAYAFEMGTIRYKEKKFDQARKYFNVAADANFNAGTSHFFLGVMDFNAKAWKDARHHLTASMTYSDAKPMTPITRYYLASTYAQMGKSDAAVHNYVEANAAVQEVETSKSGVDPMMQGIQKNALKELKALDKNQRFINVTLLNQFDSNVQTNPTEVDNATAKSSQRSLKQVLSASAGYSTSPTRTIQVTPTFTYFTNYNDHYLARDFNFMSYTPSLFAVYKPYSRLSAGIKADGTFSMKNNLDPDQSRAALKYRPYSLTGNVGPVAKYELTPRVTVGLEAYWRPKLFYLDPATGDSRRSGGGTFIKASGEFVSAFWWWNPLVYFSWEWDETAGKTFRMYAIGGGLSNPFPLTERLTLNANLDITSTDYIQSVPKRDDVLISYRMSGSYTINDHWSGMADIGYTVNNSTIVTSFKYDRWVTSAGASYTF